MKRKIILLLLTVFCLTGCKFHIFDSPDDRLTPPTRQELYHDLKRLDTYLYEIYYDDYYFDHESIVKIDDFACSSVRQDYYYGRNFDFIYNDIPEYIVHMAASKDSHASIGVTTIPTFRASDNIEEKYFEIFENIKKEYWVARAYGNRNPANESFWHTTHNSIYDIFEKNYV